MPSPGGDTGGGRAALDAARGILPTATPEVIDQIDRHVARIAVDERDPRATVLVDALRPTVHRTLLRARLAIAAGEASAACELLDTIDDDDDVLRVRVERGLLAARALGASATARRRWRCSTVRSGSPSRSDCDDL